MNNQLLRAFGIGLVGAALLTACGGGGSGDDAPAPEETAVPVSAAATPAASASGTPRARSPPSTTSRLLALNSPTRALCTSARWLPSTTVKASPPSA